MSDVDKRYADLSILSIDDLDETMRLRLNRFDAGGPPLDCRGDILASQWMTDCYNNGDEALKERMDIVMAKFLDEVLHGSSFPETARGELFLLIQSAGGQKVKNKLHELLSNHSIELVDKELAASMLKCLFARGYIEPVEFWFDWFAKLGFECGAMIFAALEMQYGIEVAMEHLPQFTESEESLLWIEVYLPQLETKWGRQKVVAALHKQWDKLSEEAQDVFSEYCIPPVAKQ